MNTRIADIEVLPGLAVIYAFGMLLQTLCGLLFRVYSPWDMRHTGPRALAPTIFRRDSSLDPAALDALSVPSAEPTSKV